MKILVIPNNLDQLDSYVTRGAEALLFGLSDYSVGFNKTIDMDTIIDITKKYKDIDIFISLNKNMFNHDLDKLVEILKTISEINIKGVLFYDLSILYLVKKNNLDINLVWNQTHMVTNYNTCNYYYEKGVEYALLSSEITLDEMIEIKEKTSIKLMATVVAHPVMSTSRRTLLTNYYKSINDKFDNHDKMITERDNNFLVKEEKNATSIYWGKQLNGTSFLPKLKEANFSYVIFNEYGFNHDDFLSILESSNLIITKDKLDELESIEKIIGNDTGFFNKKTIFKVKKNG